MGAGFSATGVPAPGGPCVRPGAALLLGRVQRRHQGATYLALSPTWTAGCSRARRGVVADDLRSSHFADAVSLLDVFLPGQARTQLLVATTQSLWTPPIPSNSCGAAAARRCCSRGAGRRAGPNLAPARWPAAPGRGPGAAQRSGLRHRQRRATCARGYTSGTSFPAAARRGQHPAADNIAPACGCAGGIEQVPSSQADGGP